MAGGDEKHHRKTCRLDSEMPSTPSDEVEEEWNRIQHGKTGPFVVIVIVVVGDSSIP